MKYARAEVDQHPEQHSHPDEHRVVIHVGPRWMVMETGTQEKCNILAAFLNKWPELIHLAIKL